MKRDLRIVVRCFMLALLGLGLSAPTSSLATGKAVIKSDNTSEVICAQQLTLHNISLPYQGGYSRLVLPAS